MPDLRYEKGLSGTVGGIDEVGRGCLAGPVVAGVAVICGDIPQALSSQIDDSKKLSPKKRRSILARLRELGCVKLATGTASVAEIDEINILKATFLAMERAVDHLERKPDNLLVDGTQVPPGLPGAIPIPKGDSISLSIAIASIFAKETRDDLMRDLASSWPAYQWERNMGYGTKAHRLALAQQGRTPFHRTSFGTIKSMPMARAQRRTS